jgi:hypothetical protein
MRREVEGRTVFELLETEEGEGGPASVDPKQSPVAVTSAGKAGGSCVWQRKNGFGEGKKWEGQDGLARGNNASLLLAGCRGELALSALLF